MTTGASGTFVISWAQTEIDGLAQAPRGAVGIGASWRWSGTAVQIDGTQEVLRLEGALGEAELRAHAARKVKKIVGRALVGTGLEAADDGREPEDPLFHTGFDVTDGLANYPITLIETGEGVPPLLMFIGKPPPRDTDLWIMRVQMRAHDAQQPGQAPTGVICFTPGTRIRTANGDVAVEDLTEGDQVQTKDDGLQDVIWTGSRYISGARLYAMPELRPIRLRRNALGQDRPEDDLIVSPGHRMLVRGDRARALFNSDEVLVRARDLLDGRNVQRDHSLRDVTYIHLLLPRHAVLFANGLETESFHPAAASLDSLADDSRSRLLGMLPELGDDPMRYGDYARRALSQAEAAILRSDAA
ncbi:MAG: Hint domain-containing protein [Maritimibacter sp.]